MKLLIVGAGQAGAWAARTARSLDATVDITLVGEEPDPPYERPPLSKDYLAGQAPLPSLLAPNDAAAQNIQLLLDSRVQRVAPKDQAVELHDGRLLAFDRLVLATGGRARLPAIPGIDSPGVHTLRTRSDADRLQTAMQAGRRLLIIGGGWIGLEVAATAIGRGLHVTLLEQQSRICGRTVPTQVSDYLLRLHQDYGVDIHLGAMVREVRRASNESLGVLTDTGTHDADLILVGAGLEPNTELAEAAGLRVDNGIVVDHRGCSSDPTIYAAGDVASQPLHGAPQASPHRQRLETWANAQQQGIRVAHAVLGHEPEPTTIPWFWSDQFQNNVQVLGCPQPDSPVTLRGNLAAHDACLYYWRGDKIQGVVAINRARELKLAKRLIQSGKTPSPEELADPAYAFGKGAR